MRAVIRVDSSSAIGIGHLMRCLTLADALAEKGWEISFICRDLPGNLYVLAEDRGYGVHRLAVSDDFSFSIPKDAKETASFLKGSIKKIDWLIVDHYSLDIQWEMEMRPFASRIMVIDDMANRSHDCNLLLDQNYYTNMEKRYVGLVPPDCRMLLGPAFALLRKEFVEARKNLKERDGVIRRVLISFGGSDPTNETGKALKAIQLIMGRDFAVTVVGGASNPHKQELKKLCSSMWDVSFYPYTDTIADLMGEADLAIGAGGTTTWERCCLGLPALVIVLSQNQFQVAQNLSRLGAIINLGWADKVIPQDYIRAINRLDAEKLKRISQKCLDLLDGRGIFRIQKELASFS